MDPGATLAKTDGDVARTQGRRGRALDFVLKRINYERSAVIPYGERGLGLARMRQLVDRLGAPDRQLRVIHIAGTKGKGSTATMVAEILTAAGYRTGLFTSPHLDRLEDRLVIDGVRASEEDFVALVEQVRPVVMDMDRVADTQHHEEGRPTYFEIVTALAMLYFAQQQVDAAVLEVGLGGRLDSTNICQPELTVITSISYDHTKQLGNTLAAIAAEKAGIIKPRVELVSGVRSPEPRDVIRTIAQHHGSAVFESGTDFDWEFHPARPPLHGGRVTFRWAARKAGESFDASLPLLGRHQGANAALAIAATGRLRHKGWDIPDNAIRAGLANANIPARIEVMQRQPTVVLDTAHNVASAEALMDVVRDTFPDEKRTLLLAVTRDKDVHGILRVLLPGFDRILVTQYVSNPRAVPLAELSGQVRRMCGVNDSITVQDAPTPALAWDWLQSQVQPQEVVVVAGSFFIAAELRSVILAHPLRSPTR